MNLRSGYPGRVLLAGWFSFEQMGAGAGDIGVRDVVGDWLDQAGRQFDMACAHPFVDGVDWRVVDPTIYSDLVFVCGPCGNGEPLTSLLQRFPHCRLHGVNLSMLQSLDEWNPFELLLERDSTRQVRPDVAFLSSYREVPVVGILLVHPQSEYGDRARHDLANTAIRGLIEYQDCAFVSIETRLDDSSSLLRDAAHVESLISRMDLVLTTRLHGLVLALKHGVPALAVDPIEGGAKVLRQAEVLGWPVVHTTERLAPEALRESFDFCRTDGASLLARRCGEAARSQLERTKKEFVSAMLHVALPRPGWQ